MLTISKPLSAGQAQSYHAKEFTAKEQSYWSERGVIAGEWQGRLAPQFVLLDRFLPRIFAKLSQGQHPVTGEQLVRQRASYEYQDADGKTSRQWSIAPVGMRPFPHPNPSHSTALVGGDDNVRLAHRESVRVALEQLENYTQAVLAATIRRKPRPNSLPRSSNTTPPPGRWLRRSATPHPCRPSST